MGKERTLKQAVFIMFKQGAFLVQGTATRRSADGRAGNEFVEGITNI